MRLIALVMLNLILLSVAGCSINTAEMSSGISDQGQVSAQKTDQANTTPETTINQESTAGEAKGIEQESIVREESTVREESILREESRMRQENRVPVLYYHSIDREPGNPLRIPPEQFEEQMAYLHEHGYTVITLNDLSEYFYGNGNGTLPSKPIVITFDDGYSDNYNNAYSIMEKYGFTGTVFMIANYLDCDGYLTTAQLEEMLAAGWELGGHTVTHPHLGEMDNAGLEYEIKTGKLILEQELNYSVKYFAYPFGEYNSEMAQMVSDSGYELAVTTERGWASTQQSPMLLNRVYCYADMGMEEFIRRISNPSY